MNQPAGPERRRGPRKANQLIAEHIEMNPHKSGRANARLIESGVSVPTIVNYTQAVEGDVNRVAQDYDLPTDAVNAALTYYRRNRRLIDAKLLLEADAEQQPLDPGGSVRSS